MSNSNPCAGRTVIYNNNKTFSRPQCDDRRPVSTLPRPIFNFLKIKTNRKTILYIYFLFIFLVLSIFYSFVNIYSVLRGIQNHKEAFSVALICKYITYIGQIGKVFGTIVCVSYLWVIGYRVRLRG